MPSETLVEFKMLYCMYKSSFMQYFVNKGLTKTMESTVSDVERIGAV